jgi:t-SNARE complex subunit (syntaxin)
MDDRLIKVLEEMRDIQQKNVELTEKLFEKSAQNSDKTFAVYKKGAKMNKIFLIVFVIFIVLTFIIPIFG